MSLKEDGYGYLEEQSRRRLARRLHDSPTQSIAALAMKLSLARRMLEHDPQAASEELEQAEELARQASKEMRYALFTLWPEILKEQGLAAALEDLAQQCKQSYGQELQLDIDGPAAQALKAAKQGILFEVAVECLYDARKQEHCGQLRATLSEDEDDMTLFEVQVDSEDAFQSRGETSGFDHLRSECELMSGRLEVENAKGQGARVRVWLPIDQRREMAGE